MIFFGFSLCNKLRNRYPPPPPPQRGANRKSATTEKERSLNYIRYVREELICRILKYVSPVKKKGFRHFGRFFQKIQ